jgi:hypothetical protein
MSAGTVHGIPPTTGSSTLLTTFTNSSPALENDSCTTVSFLIFNKAFEPTSEKNGYLG